MNITDWLDLSVEIIVVMCLGFTLWWVGTGGRR